MPSPDLSGEVISAAIACQDVFFFSPCIQLTESFLVSVSVIPRDLTMLPTAV